MVAYLSFSNVIDATEMSTDDDYYYASSPPSIDTGTTAAGAIVGTLVLVIMGIISWTCARKYRRAMAATVQQQQDVARVPSAWNVSQVWNTDAPTMERFLQDLEKKNTVADFGLAKICNRENTHDSSRGYKGTPGYSAPEFLLNNYPITYKCDVYSFGMLLFEIVGRRRNARVGSTDSLDWFPKIVWDEYEKDEMETMILKIEENNRERAKRMAMVALWCVQDSPEARPPMNAVVKMLEGGVEITPPPKPFHYLFSVGINVLNPPIYTSNPIYTGKSLDCSTCNGTNSYWYKEHATPIMAKNHKIYVKFVRFNPPRANTDKKSHTKDVVSARGKENRAISSEIGDASRPSFAEVVKGLNSSPSMISIKAFEELVGEEGGLVVEKYCCKVYIKKQSPKLSHQLGDKKLGCGKYEVASLKEGGMDVVIPDPPIDSYHQLFLD
ncbi:hypothetical protein Vadar_023923 [Vaccinium darrowii]|uniref:Uncharacterized protein n=1 Tax=Vaccinium darrowii TaxID=229202 RepID=A0ACB7X3H7_9ERIC|nr:hypothetical protein Vadar_023923 [Vaccinium darrowii]